MKLIPKVLLSMTTDYNLGGFKCISAPWKNFTQVKTKSPFVNLTDQRSYQAGLESGRFRQGLSFEDIENQIKLIKPQSIFDHGYLDGLKAPWTILEVYQRVRQQLSQKLTVTQIFNLQDQIRQSQNQLPPLTPSRSSLRSESERLHDQGDDLIMELQIQLRSHTKKLTSIQLHQLIQTTQDLHQRRSLFWAYKFPAYLEAHPESSLKSYDFLEAVKDQIEWLNNYTKTQTNDSK